MSVQLWEKIPEKTIALPVSREETKYKKQDTNKLQKLNRKFQTIHLDIRIWLLLAPCALRPRTFPVAQKRLVAVTESTGPCARLPVKRPLLAEASFSGAVMRKSAFSGTVMSKAFSPGTPVEVSFAVMGAAPEGRAEGF
jgi:hypothetical protein